MSKRFRHLNAAGDTIVEVLIVLAVLGMALSVSYATANRGLQQSRNAQEHSEALGIINSQVELLRAAYAKQAGSTVEALGTGSGNAFCLAPPTLPQLVNPTSLGTGATGFDDNVANDNMTTAAYPGPCSQDTLYHVSVINRGSGVFDFRVRWDGLGNLGRQQEELTYKIGAIIPGPSGSYTDPEVAPPPPTPSLALSLTANSSTGTITINAGTSITLSWSTSPPGATTCDASGSWSGSGKPGSGNTVIPTSVADSGKTFTYTLNCSQAGVGSAAQTVVVKVANYTPNLVPFYRLYSSSWTDHLYSIDPSEGVSCCGFASEGNVGKIDTTQGPGEIPLYRLFSPSLLDHFYTTNSAEADGAAATGYSREGISGYIMPYTGSCPTGTTPLYRMYSTSLTDHFYTIDFQEYSKLRDQAPNSDNKSKNLRYNAAEGITGCVFGTAPSATGPGPVKPKN